ncbi:MAG: hypothetical protein U0838_00060 [Chloroflexota bacterium]
MDRLALCGERRGVLPACFLDQSATVFRRRKVAVMDVMALLEDPRGAHGVLTGRRDGVGDRGDAAIAVPAVSTTSAAMPASGTRSRLLYKGI